MHWLRKLYCVISVCFEVFTQKLRLRRLPELHGIDGDVAGLNVVITGPTSGIGRETAAWFVRKGANVFLACRSVAKGDALKAELERDAAAAGMDNPHIQVMQLDVASLASVWHFLDEWGRGGAPLHVLINNAGIFSMGAPRSETVDGFEAHMGTNYLGPYLLTLGLLPFLREGGEQGRPARVVHVSSKLHEMGRVNQADPHLAARGAYLPDDAYAQSKLAQVLFASEMQRRLGQDARVVCFALHPGEVLTEVVRTLPGWLQRAYRAVMASILLTPEQGARCTVHCAASAAALRKARDEHAVYFDSCCEPVRPHPCVADVGLSRWLWAWSAQQVGLPAALQVPDVQ